MGAMIAYYVATKTDRIGKLIPVIGTPDYMWQAKYNLQAVGLNLNDFLNESTIKYLEKISPINHVDRMKYDELLILNGTIDKIVPIEQTMKFIKNYNLNNYKFKTYETGHQVIRSMQEDIFDFIEN